MCQPGVALPTQFGGISQGTGMLLKVFGLGWKIYCARQVKLMQSNVAFSFKAIFKCSVFAQFKRPQRNVADLGECQSIESATHCNCGLPALITD